MNNQIFYFFYNLAHQSVFSDKLIIFLAVYFPYLVALAAGGFLFFYRKSLRELLVVFFSSFLAFFISEVLKISFHTLRPFFALPDVQALFAESSYAFPSGHATFFSALALALFFINKKIGYLFMFFALIIGLARIAAGVHFPVDILGGFILGAGVSYLVAYFRKNV